MDQSSQSVQEATRRWLAGLLAQRQLGFYRRLAARAEWRLGRWNTYWTMLSRRGRRAVGRRLAPALLGASLLGTLVLSAAPAGAAAITVVNGEVDIDDNNVCSIVEAIENANDTTNGRPHNDCAAGDPAGADTVTLPLNGFFSLVTGVSNTNFTDNGLPYITSEVTIDGQGSVISAGSAYTYLRHFGVGSYGELTLNDTSLVYGRAEGFDSGGAIFSWGTLHLNNCTISGNSGGFNGGVNSIGYVTISDTTFYLNFSKRTAGGLRNEGTGLIENSTFSNNSADLGGGVLNNGDLTVVNSTFYSNSGRYNGGGAIFNAGDLALINATITGNSGDHAGGLLNTGSATLSRSLITNNVGYYYSEGPEVYNGFDFYGVQGTIIADGHNVIGHSGEAGIYGFTLGAGDIVPTEAPEAILEAYPTDNGGPTQTHLLVIGSPALDAAPSADCAAPPVNSLDQRGEARNQDADGSVTADECDVGAVEGTTPGGPPPGSPTLYLSPRSDGVAGGPGGIPIKTQDIAAHDLTTGDWAMHFDGSDVGVNKPIAAFTHLPDGSLLLAFTGKINLPGVNGVTTSDVVRFTPSSLGDVTSGAFELYFDGSDVGLSGSAEKIDALDVLEDGTLLISTSGNAKVPLGGGAQLPAADEDLLAFSPTATGANTAGTWSLHFDGSTVPGLAAEDLVGGHLDEATGDLYLAVLDGFNVDGVTGKGKDILKLSPNGGGYTVTRFWRGADNGFNINISGIDLE